MILEGAYQLPGRAAREAARLLVNESGEGVTLQRQDEQRYIPLADITVSAALGNIPLTLTFSDGARFVPDDDAAFRRWFYQRRSPGWVHRLERHKRGVALALLMTLLAVVAYVYVVLPWASSEIAMRIPTSVEQTLGEHTQTFLDQSGFAPSALPVERQQALQQLFRQVMPPEMRQERTPLSLKLMAAPGAPNAFMLPDGTLVLSDELVTLSKNDDGLAAVMLHEMGHHAYRHPMRQSCTTHPFRKKRLLALFSHLHHRNLNPLLSRFNTTPIVIPLFSERLYVLARLLIRCELRGNACFFNSLNNRCANMKISADFSRSFRYFV